MKSAVAIPAAQAAVREGLTAALERDFGLEGATIFMDDEGALRLDWRGGTAITVPVLEGGAREVVEELDACVVRLAEAIEKEFR